MTESLGEPRKSFLTVEERNKLIETVEKIAQDPGVLREAERYHREITRIPIEELVRPLDI